MTERWAKPAIPVLVENSSQSIWVEETPQGQVLRGDVIYTFLPEDVERFRLGHLCLRCHEPQETGFPPFHESRHLPGCSYDIRENQARDFELEFEGGRHVGPSKPMQDYLDNNYEITQTPLHFNPRTGRPSGGEFNFKRKGIQVARTMPKGALPKGKKR